MFNSNNTENLITNKFIIVYDKLTKPIAKYISNEFADKYKIVLWNKKDYRHNEARLINRNRVLFFDEDLIKENIISKQNQKSIADYAVFASHGNNAALYIKENSSIPNELLDTIKKNWRKMILMAIATRLIGVALATTFLTLNNKKKLRYSILMNAAQQLCKDDNIIIKSFLNGECC
ncbi:MAG: hypothetical protein UIC45_04365 [Paludibacteraceae bacterium]|nr:hypothetical protein [Paludibacteraceae bacterium]